MSVQVHRYLVDDLAADRDPATEVRADQTVRFAFGGNAYEIDLTDANAEKFHKRLEPYIKVARRARSTGPRSRPASGRKRSADIRAWAKEHGIEVSDRGRIRAEVVERWERAAGK